MCEREREKDRERESERERERKRERERERESVRASEENHKLLDKKGRIMYKKYVETDSYTYHLGT